MRLYPSYTPLRRSVLFGPLHHLFRRKMMQIESEELYVFILASNLEPAPPTR